MRSHRASARPKSETTRFPLNRKHSASLARASTCLLPCASRCSTLSARLRRGRVVIALRRRSLGARSGARQCAAREKGSTGARSRRAATSRVAAKRHCGGPQVALGWAGDVPKVFPGCGRSQVGGAALVALCGTRGGDLRSPTFPRLAPPWAPSPRRSVRLGPIFERFLEAKVSIRLRI